LPLALVLICSHVYSNSCHFHDAWYHVEMCKYRCTSQTILPFEAAACPLDLHRPQHSDNLIIFDCFDSVRSIVTRPLQKSFLSTTLSLKHHHAIMSGFNTSGVLSVAPARMLVPILLILMYVKQMSSKTIALLSKQKSKC
jgi:hypothetical protein